VVIHYALRSTNLIILFGIKEELPQQWNESIIVAIYKTGYKTDCSNPYVEGNFGDKRCGFRCNRSTQTFFIRQVLEKQLEYNGAEHQLYVDFEKSCDSVKREVLYNILTEIFVPMKLLRLTKVCLNEIHSKVRIDKNLSDAFPTQNGLKQRDVLSPLLFNFG
jgi:hypothetical protein